MIIQPRTFLKKKDGGDLEILLSEPWLRRPIAIGVMEGRFSFGDDRSQTGRSPASLSQWTDEHGIHYDPLGDFARLDALISVQRQAPAGSSRVYIRQANGGERIQGVAERGKQRIQLATLYVAYYR